MLNKTNKKPTTWNNEKTKKKKNNYVNKIYGEKLF